MRGKRAAILAGLGAVAALGAIGLWGKGREAPRAEVLPAVQQLPQARSVPEQAAAVAEAPVAAPPGAPDAALEDDRVCEILDGEPARLDNANITVLVEAKSAVNGTLSLSYWARDVRKHRSAPITRERVTLLNCAGVLISYGVDLDDGRGTRASDVPDAGTFRVKPVMPAMVRGRIVSDGGVVPGVIVLVLEDAAVSGKDGVFNSLVYVEAPVDVLLWVKSRPREPAWKPVHHPDPVSLAPGVVRDVGDIEVRREAPVASGKIGIAWDSMDSPSIAALVMKDTPAEKAGIQKGDEVVEVDGVSIRTAADAMQRIPGDAGTTVRLKVRRGAEYLLFDIVRQNDP